MTLTPYLASVALHSLALSALATIAVVLLRRPRPRATAAMMGVILAAGLPWFTALRLHHGPAGSPAADETSLAIQPRVPLPEWTIAHLPMERPLESPLPLDTVTEPSDRSSSAPAVQPLQMPSPRDATAWLWLAGAAGGLLALVFSTLRLAFWTRSLPRPAEDEIARLSTLLPIPRAARSIRLGRDDRGACVAGLFRPVIVLPRELLEPDRERPLCWTLRHEACHWRSHDSRWVHLLASARSAFWWNPLIHYLSSSWAAARERACDLEASGSDRAAYGKFLIAMASLPAPSARRMAVPMVRRRRMRLLKRRIISLLNSTPDDLSAGGRSRAALAAGFALCALLVSGLSIAEDAAGTASSSPLGQPTFPPPVNRPEVSWEPLDGPWHTTSAVKSELPARWLRVRMAAVLSPEALPSGADVIFARDAAAFRDQIAANPRNAIHSFPTFISGDGQTATTEQGRDAFFAGEAGERQKTFAGWKLQVTGRVTGTTVEIDTQGNYGFVPGENHFQETFGPQMKVTTAPEKIITRQARAKTAIAPGDIQVIRLGEVDPGCHATLLLQAEEFTGKGRSTTAKLTTPEKLRLDAFVATYELPEAERESHARSLLPRITGISSPWMTRLEVEAALSTQRLGAVEVTTGEFSQPWPALGKLRLGIGVEQNLFDRHRLLVVEGAPSTPFARWSQPDQIWVVELKPSRPDVREVLYLTANPAE